MLDNLVFYYDNEKFYLVSERLEQYPHCFKISWKLTQITDVWKKCFTVFVTAPIPLFVNNFHSLGQNGVLRCFPLQIHWFNYINASIQAIEKFEKEELDFMLEILKGIKVERWHYESTIAVGRSQTIYENIIKTLQNLGWKIQSLQPDPEKILQRDKYLLWYIVHPSRKIAVKGYVTNATKYPKCFRNMTKTEIVLPVMDFNKKGVKEILSETQRIRRELVNIDMLTETCQIIWAKAMVDPEVFTWMNNSISLNIAFTFLQKSHEDQKVTPFPYVYTSQEEALEILKQIKIEGGGSEA